MPRMLTWIVVVLAMATYTEALAFQGVNQLRISTSASMTGDDGFHGHGWASVASGKYCDDLIYVGEGNDPVNAEDCGRRVALAPNCDPGYVVIRPSRHNFCYCAPKGSACSVKKDGRDWEIYAGVADVQMPQMDLVAVNKECAEGSLLGKNFGTMTATKCGALAQITTRCNPEFIFFNDARCCCALKGSNCEQKLVSPAWFIYSPRFPAPPAPPPPPTPPTPEAPEGKEPVVKCTINVKGIDQKKLDADEGAKAALEESVGNAVAEISGVDAKNVKVFYFPADRAELIAHWSRSEVDGVQANDVAVEVSQGSVKVIAEVTVTDQDNLIDVATALGDSAAVESDVVQALQNTPDVVSVTDGIIDATVQPIEIITASPTSSPTTASVYDYAIINGELVGGQTIQSDCSDLSVCGGEGKFVMWQMADPLAGDFVATTTFTASTIARTALAFILRTSDRDFNLGLDGNGNTFFFEPPLVYYGATTVQPGVEVEMTVSRNAGKITVALDGVETPLQDVDMPSELVAIGWRPWRNEIAIKNLRLQVPTPTQSPTPLPSVAPTSPTPSPTDSPTPMPPTVAPTTSPTTDSPSPMPTVAPTTVPSQAPTPSPTPLPPGATFAPTAAPTPLPPTAAPTESPTPSPTDTPTPVPSESPTLSPTHSPTEACYRAEGNYQCQFPFEWKGYKFYSCTEMDHHRLWCITTEPDHRFAHCDCSIPTPPATTLTQPASAGDTQLAVVSTVGFEIGDEILIGTESNYIDGFGSILLRFPLENSWPPGTTIVQVAPTAAPTTAPTAFPPTTPCAETGTCSVYEDPHIRVFDGGQVSLLSTVSSDEQLDTTGDMWLVQSADISIQARYLPDPEIPADNVFVRAVAIGGAFLGGNILVVGPLDKGLTWNGKPILETQEATFQASAGHGTIRATRSYQSHLVEDMTQTNPGVDIELPLGVNITFNRLATHVNLFIQMPRVAGGQDGLCGNFNCDPFDDSLAMIKNNRNPKVREGMTLFPSDY